MALVLLTAVLAGPVVITPAPDASLEAQWHAEMAQNDWTLSVSLLEQWREIQALSAALVVTEPAPIQLRVPEVPRAPREHPPHPEGVEQWRALVSQHFQPDDVEMALRIIWCESRGNPYAENPNSTASGLFQHLRGWWSGAWGLPAFDPFDPAQSISAGAALRYSNGGWSDWNASRGCW